MKIRSEKTKGKNRRKRREEKVKGKKERKETDIWSSSPPTHHRTHVLPEDFLKSVHLLNYLFIQDEANTTKEHEITII